MSGQPSWPRLQYAVMPWCHGKTVYFGEHHFVLTVSSLGTIHQFFRGEHQWQMCSFLQSPQTSWEPIIPGILLFHP